VSPTRRAGKAVLVRVLHGAQQRSTHGSQFSVWMGIEAGRKPPHASSRGQGLGQGGRTANLGPVRLSRTDRLTAFARPD
jgi:hypothetical protein